MARCRTLHSTMSLLPVVKVTIHSCATYSDVTHAGAALTAPDSRSMQASQSCTQLVEIFSIAQRHSQFTMEVPQQAVELVEYFRLFMKLGFD